MTYIIKKLGEICKIKTGKKDANYSTDDGLYPFFTCGDKILKSPGYSFEGDVILIAGNGNVGACKKYNGKFEAYQRTYILDDFTEIDKDFLFYYLDGFLKKLLITETLGSAVPYIKLGSLQNRNIPLPPFPTQKLIVQKLDKAFEKLDKSIELLKRNIENLSEIQENILEGIFSKNEWEKEILEDVLDICEYGSSEKASDDKNGIPIFRMGNIQNGKVVFENMKYLNKNSKDIPKLYLKNEDLLFNRTNSWELVGKTGMFLGESDKYTFAGYLIRLRFDNKKISQKFMNYYFNSKYFRRNYIEPQIDQQCGQANFSGGKLKTLFIPLSPLQTQKQIVSHLDQVFETNKKLKEKYEKELKSLEEIRESVLREAFEM